MGLVPRIFSQTVSDSDRLFWLLNAGGWISLSVVTYVSLSLPYDQLQFAYIAHNILQSILGFLLSIPLRQAFKATWNWPATTRVIIAVMLILVVATVWAVMRLQLLIVIASESEADLWDDFGGFLFPSLFVFLAWVSLYHLVKYAQLLQNERESMLVLEAGRRKEAFKLVSAESAAREAQLKLLRYQLNPHFLFNTLNSIASLVSARRSDDAQSMIGELSTFLRFSLESDRNITVPLRDEIEALDLYLRIEQVRFSDRLVVEQEIDPRALPEQVPSLLLQPLVENAIKHAIGRAENGGRILITVKLHDQELVVTVEDSGSGGEGDQPQLDQLFDAPDLGFEAPLSVWRIYMGTPSVLTLASHALGG